jgi:hypothetical protein
MQTIGSRSYTNMALTAVILLLLALVVQPYLSIPQAQAQISGSMSSVDQSPSRTSTTNPGVENAAATRDVAAALKDVAAALKEQATAQKEIGRALFKLSSADTTAK